MEYIQRKYKDNKVYGLRYIITVTITLTKMQVSLPILFPLNREQVCACIQWEVLV